MLSIETIDLSHDFGGLQVLKGLNFKLIQGERHAIIGPNGAGKTTFFNIMTGVYRPSKGRILFKGRNITGFKPYKINRLGIGRSFQISSVFGDLTAFQNLRLAVMAKYGIRFNILKYIDKLDKLTTETDNLLERVGLSDQRDVLASNLSYGKSRVLEIAMAFALDPEVVCLDEFAAGMSREETSAATELVRQLTEGKTAVLIEHDMDVVFSLADRISVLHHGKILITGRPDEVRNNPEVKSAYLGELHPEDDL